MVFLSPMVFDSGSCHTHSFGIVMVALRASVLWVVVVVCVVVVFQGVKMLVEIPKVLQGAWLQACYTNSHSDPV